MKGCSPITIVSSSNITLRLNNMRFNITYSSFRYNHEHLVVLIVIFVVDIRWEEAGEGFGFGEAEGKTPGDVGTRVRRVRYEDVEGWGAVLFDGSVEVDVGVDSGAFREQLFEVMGYETGAEIGVVEDGFGREGEEEGGEVGVSIVRGFAGVERGGGRCGGEGGRGMGFWRRFLFGWHWCVAGFGKSIPFLGPPSLREFFLLF